LQLKESNSANQKGSSEAMHHSKTAQKPEQNLKMLTEHHRLRSSSVESPSQSEEAFDDNLENGRRITKPFQTTLTMMIYVLAFLLLVANRMQQTAASFVLVQQPSSAAGLLMLTIGLRP
jgi:hypothetical protein